MSFTGALKILRCRLPEVPKHGRGLTQWFADLVAEVAEEVLEERRKKAGNGSARFVEWEEAKAQIRARVS